jgi:signal transduction histidine kinase
MKEIWDQCSSLGADVQTLSHELHSSILDHLGLAAAADNFCAEFSHQHGVRVEFTQQNVPNSLPRDVSLSLFRILQETVRNAFKHSGVKLFHVRLAGAPRELILQIRDQGIGFDVQMAKANGGIGLISMQERVSLLHGSLAIESDLQQGTKIEVSIPLLESDVKAAKKAAAGSC